MERQKGMLYLCATPIGNLEDLTFRAARILGEVQLIAAEDTRHTRKLLSHYQIHTPLTSYHEHNKLEKGPELIERLLAGDNVALVSDAGLPGIADPGVHLARLAIESKITVSPIPGANAALSGLICSGLDTTRFAFAGFLPKTAKKRREVLNDLKERRETLVFYESPHQLKATLKEMNAVFGGDRSAVAARELTKKFEEFIRGTLATLSARFEIDQPRGEFCIIVAEAEPAQAESPSVDTDPANYVLRLMRQGTDKKSAIKQAAIDLRKKKRDVYQALLSIDKKTP